MGYLGLAVLACLGLLVFVHAAEPASYDYVIVGAGTAGSVIAEKLSRDPKNSVLVIEKGGDQSETFSTICAFYDTLVQPQTERNLQLFGQRNIYDAAYRTFETEATQWRPQIASAAILAGGGSVINGNAMTWPSRAELAFWNSSLWTFEATLHNRKELETYRPCFEAGGCDERIHGKTGPIHMTKPKVDPVSKLVYEAIKNEFSLVDNPDCDSGDSDGMSVMGRNIDVEDGVPHRHDSFSRVLKPHIGKRSNLKVLFYSPALKVKLNKATGIHDVVYLNNYETKTVTANKKVILSCGSMCTPRLLMHSGVGDCDELKKFDIDCVVSNPQVGKNLIDAVAASMVFVSLTGGPKPEVRTNGTVLVGYYRSPQFTGDGTDMEVSLSPLFLRGWFVYFIQMAMNVHHDHGYITLKDKDPTSDPLLTFNFLNTPKVALPLVDQFRKIRKAMAKLAIPNLFRLNETLLMLEIAPSMLKIPPLVWDSWIEGWFASDATALKHQTGSCRLGDVVNEKLNLIDSKGVEIPGIALADLSIVPAPVRTHSGMSMAMLVGSRVVDFILDETCVEGKCGKKA